jgi:hypothetical protein
MVDVLHTVIQTILYVRSSEVRNLNHARGGMYHHRVASKVIVVWVSPSGYSHLLDDIFHDDEACVKALFNNGVNDVHLTQRGK